MGQIDFELFGKKSSPNRFDFDHGHASPFSKQRSGILSLCESFNLPIHLVLTKADKLNNKETQNTLKVVSEKMADYPAIVDSLVFSSTKKIGLETLLNKIKLLLEV